MRSTSNTLRVASALLGSALCGIASGQVAGPYSAALNDPGNPHDAPVPGFVGLEGLGMARYSVGLDPDGTEIFINPRNYLNPTFFGWASEVVEYIPSEPVVSQYGSFDDPALALGPVTGDNFDVVSLGDMTSPRILAGENPGTITIKLAKPLRNLSGADFVVFENGLVAQSNQGGFGVGGVFGELAYVEASSDNGVFHRFPSVSQTVAPVSSFGTVDSTKIYNLAGKHANRDDCWGTPFDLEDLELPDSQEILFIRIVDIPGNGAFLDSVGNRIYDPHKTFGSGGFDLEAVGAISTAMTYPEWPQLAHLAPADRAPNADPDGDGVANLLEYAFATLPWKPDVATPKPELTNNHAAISFIRDERLTDLIYEVQASSTMASQDWTTLASGSAGAPVQGANGHNPAVSESSAESIQSIGVIRRTTVRDIAPLAPGSRRFLRVKVTTTSVYLPAE